MDLRQFRKHLIHLRARHMTIPAGVLDEVALVIFLSLKEVAQLMRLYAKRQSLGFHTRSLPVDDLAHDLPELAICCVPIDARLVLGSDRKSVV